MDVTGPETLCGRAVRAVLERAAPDLQSRPLELGIVLADDAAVQELNRTWRGVDRPTNVLAFPLLDAAVVAAPRADAPTHLGDIVLAHGTVLSEAKAGRRPVEHHVCHLVVHGALHLLGHDHQTEPEAEAMERLETEILDRLGVPDPHAGGPLAGADP